MITDSSDPNLLISYKIDDILYEKNTGKQDVKIVKTVSYGEALFINGVLQSTQKDEYIYHEAMVHTLLSGMPYAKKVLIIGGSEGCLCREILKYPNIEEIVQVDWDSELVGLFKNEFAHWNNNVYADKRIKLVFEDALKFLKKNKTQYDAVFIDLFDPVEDTLDFFKEVIVYSMNNLSLDGGLIINAGSVSPISTGCAEIIADWLKPIWLTRLAVHIHVPSFMQEWCLISCMPLQWTNKNFGIETKYFNINNYSKWSKDYSKSLKGFSNLKNWDGSVPVYF